MEGREREGERGREGGRKRGRERKERDILNADAFVHVATRVTQINKNKIKVVLCSYFE